jgi:GNAT superfamily N-acetyltransferase
VIVEIRRLEPAEVTAELLGAVAHQRVWPQDPEGSLARACKLCVEEERAILIAYVEGKPVGLAEVQDYGQSVWRDFSVARLHGIQVESAYRQQGIGRKLFDAVVAWAAARPHPGHLEWQASPTAIEFYRRLGFEPDYESDLKEYPFYDIDLRMR